MTRQLDLFPTTAEVIAFPPARFATLLRTEAMTIIAMGHKTKEAKRHKEGLIGYCLIHLGNNLKQPGPRVRAMTAAFNTALEAEIARQLVNGSPPQALRK